MLQVINKHFIFYMTFYRPYSRPVLVNPSSYSWKTYRGHDLQVNKGRLYTDLIPSYVSFAIANGSPEIEQIKQDAKQEGFLSAAPNQLRLMYGTDSTVDYISPFPLSGQLNCYNDTHDKVKDNIDIEFPMVRFYPANAESYRRPFSIIVSKHLSYAYCFWFCLRYSVPWSNNKRPSFDFETLWNEFYHGEYSGQVIVLYLNTPLPVSQSLTRPDIMRVEFNSPLADGLITVSLQNISPLDGVFISAPFEIADSMLSPDLKNIISSVNSGLVPTEDNPEDEGR
nr:hypothetical protein [Banfec virus 2]